jgi:predicted lipoprotein with Yx(FWY)xxD motif
MKRSIAILAIAPALLVLAACGSSDTSSNGGSSASSQGSTTKNTQAATTSPVVMAVTKPKVGRVLVDAQGFTLYRYTPDTTSTSTCTGACIKFWPPARVTGGGRLTASGVSGKVTTTTRADGTKQLVFNGRPLYRFVKDKTKADANGQGFEHIWFVVPAKGAKKAAAAPPAASNSKSAYGY